MKLTQIVNFTKAIFICLPAAAHALPTNVLIAKQAIADAAAIYMHCLSYNAELLDDDASDATSISQALVPLCRHDFTKLVALKAPGQTRAVIDVLVQNRQDQQTETATGVVLVQRRARLEGVTVK